MVKDSLGLTVSNKQNWIARRFSPECIGGTLVTLVAALPLLHIPGSTLVSIQLQSLVLVILGLIVVVYKPYFDVLGGNLRATSLAVKVGLALFIGLAIVSSLLTHGQPLPQTLLGSYPEYIGLLQWLSILILGFFVQGQLSQVKNSFTLPLLASLIVLISIFSDRALIFSDFQLSGLLFQATSLAMYACFGFAFLLGNFPTYYKKRPLLSIMCFVILTFGVLLAQSRIGLFAYALICALTLVTKPHVVKTILLALSAIALIFISLLSPHLITRYQNEDVAHGLQYRKAMYATSIHEIADKHLLIGNGGGVHPVYLNQQKDVPADIAKDLDIGLRFASAHDLLIDIGLMFGLIPCLTIVLAIIWAIRNYLQAFFQHREVAMILAFLVLLLAVFVNVPSLTLTPLFVLFLIAGLRKQYARRN